jgi:RimJ/RimL family protein N-acetyltransferase
MKRSTPQDEHIPFMYETWREEETPTALPYDELPPDRLKQVNENWKKYFTIYLDGDKVLAWVSKIDREQAETINIGFHLCPEYRGQGLMKKILKDFMSSLRLDDYLKPFTAETKKTNIAAQKVMESAGFEKTGENENSICYIYAPGPKAQGE